MAFTLKSKLPRLAREFYQGRAVVMWTHGIGQRATGWLSVSFHASFREVLLRAEGYWEKYWKICGRLVESQAGPCAHAQGYEDKGNDPVARSMRSGTTSK